MNKNHDFKTNRQLTSKEMTILYVDTIWRIYLQGNQETKREGVTCEVPRLAFVDVDLRDGIDSEGFAANLALEVVYDQLLICGVEPEPGCQRRRRCCWWRWHSRGVTAHGRHFRLEAEARVLGVGMDEKEGGFAFE